ncbi:MAG TPA: hypothetical protein VHD31_03120 [Candidatus Paceibacterota bacterium]|nr:hypothetical protein [Candidatus Paceibacterota bacterium]
MNEVVHADIFFFITSLAVLCITIGILMVLYYLIPVARDLREIVGKIRKAGDEVEKDFEALRANLREEGTKGKTILNLVFGFLTRTLQPPTKPRTKKQPPSSEL